MEYEFLNQMKDRAGLGKLVQLESPDMNLDIDLQFVDVAVLMVHYSTEHHKADHYMLRDDPHTRVRTGVCGASVSGKGIPEDATHYLLGKSIEYYSDGHDFVPIAFFRQYEVKEDD